MATENLSEADLSIEALRVLERERFAEDERKAERKLRAIDRYFRGPTGIAKETLR